ncbi:hypothetical protein GQ53DRAFT_636853, partial [Thozetella sp. PMI_491]
LVTAMEDPRPNSKSRIVRSRSGCLPCRQRHTKCDETKPHCRTCIRLNIACPGYATSFVFRDDTEAVSRRSAAIDDDDTGRVAENANGEIIAGEQVEDEYMTPSSSTNAGSTLVPGSLAPELLSTVSEQPSSDSAIEGLVLLAFSRGNIAASSPAQPTMSASELDASMFHTPPNPPPSTACELIGFTDRQLSENFPRQLPTLFQDIWEGVGYANLALKCAILALDSLTRGPDGPSANARGDCLEFYTAALQQMAAIDLLAPLHITQVVVSLTILTVFLRIETKLGTFIGGITHCSQADKLVTVHIDELVSWRTGRRVLSHWASSKAWYSIQTLPWSPLGHELPKVAREPLWQLFRESSDLSNYILVLLCECKQIYTRLLFGRLFGPNASWPLFRAWARQFEAIVSKPLPVDGIYAPETEEDYLARLGNLRNALDGWHDQLPMCDLPLHGQTARGRELMSSLPPAMRFEPLRFQSSRAAINYIRYAVAQIICSREVLDNSTGGDLSGEPYLDPWVVLVLQILHGLSSEPNVEEELVHVGLMMAVHTILCSSPHPVVLDALDSLFPFLERFSATPGSMIPPWLLRNLLTMFRVERARGRILLCAVSDLGATEELSIMWTKPCKHKVMLMGRIMETGASFFDVVDVH